MKIKKIEELTEKVEGFLSQNGSSLKEGEVLFYLAKKCPRRGEIAEIGSWKGKSTIWLGKGAEFSDNKIFAIDPHTGSTEHQKKGQAIWTFDEFKKNIAKANLSKRVIPIVKHSSKATEDVLGPLNLLFIDGAHDYASVKKDFMHWYPKLKMGGMIAFHDSFLGWPGVRQLVHEKIFKGTHFSKIRYINSITFATRQEKLTLFQKIENYFLLFIKILHEKSLNLPQPFKSLAKHLIWMPFKKRWLQELEQT